MNTYYDQLIRSAMDTGNIYMTYFIIPSMDAVGQASLDSNPGVTTYQLYDVRKNTSFLCTKIGMITLTFVEINNNEHEDLNTIWHAIITQQKTTIISITIEV